MQEPTERGALELFPDLRFKQFAPPQNHYICGPCGALNGVYSLMTTVV